MQRNLLDQNRRSRHTIAFCAIYMLILGAMPRSADAQDSAAVNLYFGATASDSIQTQNVLVPSGRFARLQGSYPLLLAGPHAAKEIAVAGDTLDLATLRGKLVLLDFWTSWCRPCIEEIPEMNAFAQVFRDRDDFVFISVNQDAVTSGGDLEYVRELVRDRKIEYPVLIDDAEPSLKKAFTIRAWPMRIMISPDGEILQRTTGRLTLEAAADHLRER